MSSSIREEEDRNPDGDDVLPAALVTLAASTAVSVVLTAAIVWVATAENNETAMTATTLGLVCAGCYLLWTAKYVTFA